MRRIANRRIIVILLYCLIPALSLSAEPQDIFLVNDPVVLGEESFSKRIHERTREGEYPLGLVLSGGSARAFAHIGVLRYLEEIDVVPDFIVSNSMGSIVGILYAAGMSPDQIYTIFDRISTSELFSLKFPLRGGLIGTMKIEGLLSSVLGDIDLNELPIPIMVICEDLTTKREIRITEGNAITVMKAAYALPVYFDPVDFRSYRLIDGGISNLVPVDAAVGYSDTIIASTTFYQNPNLNLYNPLTILNVSMDISKARRGVDQLEVYTPYVIQCDVEDFSFMSFDRLEEIDAAGYRSAAETSSLPFEYARAGATDFLEEVRNTHAGTINAALDDYQYFKAIEAPQLTANLLIGVESSYSEKLYRQLEQSILFGAGGNVFYKDFFAVVSAGGLYSPGDTINPGAAFSTLFYPENRIRLSGHLLWNGARQNEIYTAGGITAVPYTTQGGNRLELFSGFEFQNRNESLLSLQGKYTHVFSELKTEITAGYQFIDLNTHSVFAEAGAEALFTDELSLNVTAGARTDILSDNTVPLLPHDSPHMEAQSVDIRLGWNTVSFRYHLNELRPTFGELIMFRDIWLGVYGEVLYGPQTSHWGAGIEGTLDMSLIGLKSMTLSWFAGYETLSDGFTGGLWLTL